MNHGILTYTDLVKAVEDGVMTGVHPDQINGASIDVTLGDRLLVERANFATPHAPPTTVRLYDKQGPELVEMPLNANGEWVLVPGQFALAETRETFHLPDNIAGHYMLKSSLARGGLQHLMAGWCDPTWHGSVLTMELRNALMWHPIALRPGMKIGQMVFWRGASVPYDRSYAVRGRYNQTTTVTESKGV